MAHAGQPPGTGFFPEAGRSIRRINYTTPYILFFLHSCFDRVKRDFGTHRLVMDRLTMAKNKAPKPGRPPKDLAGGVQTRILDAAQQLFLEKGFRSTSIDEIAERAPASKPTIYAHFPGKEALFTAVVGRTINELTDFAGFTPQGRTIQDKLANIATEIVERFIADTLDLTRATIAEARRFPELSRNVHDAARDRAAGAVSQILDDTTQRLARAPKGPFSDKRRLATAQMFMDLILLPMLMRSLMGEELKDLRKDLPSFLHERIGFFLAACETGWAS
jgi:AcrR family transcriptional regulator